jgi:major membrane immunogen (membrane-anchored lipoprotein)
MFKKRAILGCAIVLMLAASLMGCGTSSSSEPVTIQNKGTYYQVVLNFQNTSHKDIGIEFGKKVIQTIPNLCQLLDSYIADLRNYK